MQGGRLTSKAYQATYQDTSTANFLYSQWDYSGNYHLYKEFPLVGDGDSIYNCYQFSFAGEYYGDKALLWAVEIYDSSGRTRLYTTGAQYYDTGQVVAVGLPSVSPNDYSQHNDIVYRCHIWVKRKDGGTVDRTSMYASNWTWYLNRSVDVEENTLPADWFETTTQSTGVFIPLTTETTPIDNYTGQQGGTGSDGVQRDIDYYLQFPAVAASFAQFVFTVFGRLFALQYVEGYICYGMVVGTVLFVYDKLGGY